MCSVSLTRLLIVIGVASFTVGAQAQHRHSPGHGVAMSVGYFKANLIDGGGLGSAVLLDAGRFYGAGRIDLGFAEVPVSDDYETGEPEMSGSACIERATGEPVAEVFCLGSGGVDVYYGAFSLEAGYVLPLPVYAVLGAGVRSGEELDREDGKTLATRPYGTAQVRRPLARRIDGFVQVHFGPSYAQGRVGLILFHRPHSP